MAASDWLGIGSLIILVGFLVLAFRGSSKLKREKNPPPERDGAD